MWIKTRRYINLLFKRMTVMVRLDKSNDAFIQKKTDALFAFLIFVAMICCCNSETVTIKIVDSPANNIAWGTGHQYNVAGYESSQLKARVKAANVSGPPLLHRLHNKCFTANISSYEYSFCPFANITQKEFGSTWLPFHGILGVWQEWQVSNYSFAAQLYKEGDNCGHSQRTVKVTFVCGPSEGIISVTEPSTCQYELSFRTRLVCHRDTLLVYPTLSATLRYEWDELEGLWGDGHLTQQGYTKKLDKILQNAGYKLSWSTKTSLMHDAQASQPATFTSLTQCRLEYDKLQQEVLSLRRRLESETT